MFDAGAKLYQLYRGEWTRLRKAVEEEALKPFIGGGDEKEDDEIGPEKHEEPEDEDDEPQPEEPEDEEEPQPQEPKRDEEPEEDEEP